jgi:hypothetical protein
MSLPYSSWGVIRPTFWAFSHPMLVVRDRAWRSPSPRSFPRLCTQSELIETGSGETAGSGEGTRTATHRQPSSGSSCQSFQGRFSAAWKPCKRSAATILLTSTPAQRGSHIAPGLRRGRRDHSVVSSSRQRGGIGRLAIGCAVASQGTPVAPGLGYTRCSRPLPSGDRSSALMRRWRNERSVELHGKRHVASRPGAGIGWTEPV